MHACPIALFLGLGLVRTDAQGHCCMYLLGIYVFAIQNTAGYGRSTKSAQKQPRASSIPFLASADIP